MRSSDVGELRVLIDIIPSMKYQSFVASDIDDR